MNIGTDPELEGKDDPEQINVVSLFWDTEDCENTFQIWFPHKKQRNVSWL